jgi:(+)-trans-carveol dehydrogenase
MSAGGGGRFEGKVAFITGVARGQGASHAVRLAEEGADVIGVDSCGEVEGAAYPAASTADLEGTRRAVEALGRRAILTVADVRDREALRAAVDVGVAELGRLDVVAANAGIVNLPKPAVELEPRLWQQMIDVNLTGAWNTCQVAAPHLIEGGRGGAIVITSSAAALRGYPSVANYVSAKHGLVGLTRALAMELGPHRIRVNHIAPTQVSTEMIHNEAIYKLFVPEAEEPTREEFAEASEAMHLLPTPWVEPVDVSNALLFLASEEGRFITAASLPVDAGVTQH